MLDIVGYYPQNILVELRNYVEYTATENIVRPPRKQQGCYGDYCFSNSIAAPPFYPRELFSAVAPFKKNEFIEAA